MGNINLSRVLLGGLAAGLVANVVGFVNQLVFAEQMQEQLTRLGLQEPGGGAMAIFILLGFVAGIVLIWIYAAMRPRFGAGPGTAIKAAIAVWIVASLIPSISFALIGLFPGRTMTIGTIFDLVVFIVAALIGAWVYREEAAAAG